MSDPAEQTMSARLGGRAESERSLFAFLLAETPDRVYFKDRGGRFVRASAATAAFFGCTPEELLGTTDFDYLATPSAQESFDEELRIMETGEPSLELEEEEIWPDGSVTWCVTSRMPWRNDAGEVVGTFGYSRDITQRRRAELELREKTERLDRIYAGAAIGIALVDRDGRVVEGNPALAELLGYDLDELAGTTFRTHVHRDDASHALALDRELLDGDRETYRLEQRYVRKNGEILWGALAVSLMRDASGTPQFAIHMIENVTERKWAEEELRLNAARAEHQALHDGLTGLPNRTLFSDRIERALLAARREGGRVAVLLMDLDRFKEINDTLGHAAGDHVLKVVAGRLEECVRASDTVARLGGDEFGLVLPGQIEPGELELLLEKLSLAVEQSIDHDGMPLAIESSIGVAFFPDHGADAADLMKKADVAMYQAKESRYRHALYEPATDRHDPVRLTLAAELRRALKHEQLVLRYQPKASLPDGTVRSVEALLRWHHPERGVLEPDDFVPQAAETGLMRPLTLYVVERALEQALAWKAEGLELAVSVNVATRNILDASFPDDIGSLLSMTGAAPSLLQLEIAEATVLEDPFRTEIVLDRLHRLGIRLAIDDFGTGYSALHYLRQLPVSEIKIDRSFVLAMEESADDATIVRSAIGLGKSFGVDVLAEGVATEEIRGALEALGADGMQGFALSEPLAPDELAAWMRARRA
jgi:diguanylate cyclase (GGDEF)-like protein/PAS domain S-box-containing protein